MRLFGALLGALALQGCGAAPFPSKIFTIEAEDADCPVMLSQTPGGGASRPFTMSSQTRDMYASNKYYTISAHGESATMTEQLATTVRGCDMWVQIDRVEYRADDVEQHTSARSSRQLTLEGRVQQ